jgi:hypothetical protein
MMQNTALDHVPVGTVFHLVVAPTHFSRRVLAFLDREGGPIAWPPRSPDLSPLDSCFRGFVKDTVYREKLQNMNEFRGRTIRAAECVTNEMLTNTWPETKYRIVCLVPVMAPY